MHQKGYKSRSLRSSNNADNDKRVKITQMQQRASLKWVKMDQDREPAVNKNGLLLEEDDEEVWCDWNVMDGWVIWTQRKILKRQTKQMFAQEAEWFKFQRTRERKTNSCEKRRMQDRTALENEIHKIGVDGDGRYSDYTRTTRP
jgi:hypothetical protein